MRRFLLAWVVPPLLLAGAVLLPVILGWETFFQRDVFSVHLELRHAVAEGFSGIEPRIPLVDPHRGGGQPLAGNPNAVALHPTALLHLALPLFAAFNAHFWLHLLAAPFALLWLGRELGLPRRAAWAAAVTWAFSGFMASQLAFFNLVAGVALAPAFAAAAVRTVRRRAGGRPAAGATAAAGILAALLVTSGDPMTAAAGIAAGLALAATEPALRRVPGRRRLRTAALLLAALAAGALLALPQVTELLRILPASQRATGYQEAVRLAGSFDPRQALELLVPFPFGRPDLVGPGGFWGYRFHQGSWAFYSTLYPGLAALALLAASGRAWRLPGALGAVARRGWILVGAGLFVALGAFNPVVAALFSLPALDVLRYPLKLWLWVALGGALLCGVGFARLTGGAAGEAEGRDGASAETEAGPPSGERTADRVGSEDRLVEGDRDGAPARSPRSAAARAERARALRRALVLLAALATLFAAAWLLLGFAPGAANGALQSLIGQGAPTELADAERWRWAGAAARGLGAAVLFAAVLVLTARRPALGGPLLLALHAATQLALLQPALATDAAAPYRQPPELLAALPADVPVAHGAHEGLFGQPPVETGRLARPELHWLYRRTFADAYPFAGALWGRRYDLNPSPEGLDTAALHRAAGAVASAPDDRTRLRLLAAWGIGRLLLARPLDPEAAELVRPLARRSEPGNGRTTTVYRIAGAAPSAYLATGRLYLHPDAPPGAAAAVLADDRFRPGRDAVLPGPGTSDPGTAPGSVTVVEERSERLVVDTSAAEPGVLVWQRARLPLHRGRVDGEPAPVRTVNLYRVGVEVPAGEHQVVIEIDRGPLRLALAGSALGLALLVAIGLVAARRSGTGARRRATGGAATDGSSPADRDGRRWSGSSPTRRPRGRTAEPPARDASPR